MAAEYAVSILLSAKDAASGVFAKVSDAAQGTLGKLDSAWEKHGAKIDTLANQVGVAGGVIAGALGLAGQKSMEFGAEITEIGTLSSGAAAQMEAYGQGVLKMAGDLGQGTSVLTGALYQANSAGIAAEDALGFVGDSSKYATAAVTDTETAVNSLTTVLNAYGESADQTTKYSDLLFATIQQGKVNAAQLDGVLGQIAPTAATAGVSFDQVAAAMATLTLSGGSAAERGTQLNELMMAIATPTEDAAKAAKAMGIELSATALATKGLDGVMRDVAEATDGDIEKLSQLFPSVTALKGASVLAADGAGTLTEKMTAMGEASGVVAKGFDMMSNTAAFKMKQAKASFEAASISIGQNVQTILAPLAGVVAWMTNLVASHQWLAKTIAIVGGVVGGLALTFAGVAKAIGLYHSVLEGVNAAKTIFNLLTGRAAAAAAAETAATAAGTAAKVTHAGAVELLTVAEYQQGAAAVGAGAATYAAMLPVLGVLAAVLLAVRQIKYAWDAWKFRAREKAREAYADAQGEELDAQMAFREQYQAQHGSLEGVQEAWQASAEYRGLKGATQAAKGEFGTAAAVEGADRWDDKKSKEGKPDSLEAQIAALQANQPDFEAMLRGLQAGPGVAPSASQGAVGVMGRAGRRGRGGAAAGIGAGVDMGAGVDLAAMGAESGVAVSAGPAVGGGDTSALEAKLDAVVTELRSLREVVGGGVERVRDTLSHSGLAARLEGAI